MSVVNVLVAAATTPDVKAVSIAEGIAASVALRPDMKLVEREPVREVRVDPLLRSLSLETPCALVVVGPSSNLDRLAERWLAARADFVFLRVDVDEDVVRISVRDPRMDAVLLALRDLVDRAGGERSGRILQYQLPSLNAAADSAERPHRRPLLDAAVGWVHSVLQDAVAAVPEDKRNPQGFLMFSSTPTTLLESLSGTSERDPESRPPALEAADAQLDAARAAADPKTEPLAAAAETFELGPLEFRMLLLGLAPELDHRYQRCMGFLLDDMGRRVGTVALYTTLLNMTASNRGQQAHLGALVRWLAFDAGPSHQPAADEPLRLDPFLALWLLGESGALACDPRVRRALRPMPWPGPTLLDGREEHVRAAGLLASLQGPQKTQWLLLAGDDPAGWRALLELAAKDEKLRPIRVEARRLAGTDVLEIDEAGRRLGRMARLSGRPLFIDLAGAEGTEAEDHWVRRLLFAVAGTGCPAAVVSTDVARVIRLVGAAPHELPEEPALPMAARVAAVREAARRAEAPLTEDAAQAIAERYPLGIDGVEHAMHLALARPKDLDADDPSVARFTTACKDVAAEGLSRLAERIDPVFTLEDVVLPADRKQQLEELVDNVRFASRVLDGWKFRDQLPYGRGVTALFSGPSGTGKTMAAMGVANRLGIQLLRLDLSKVVSKYIGDTEKNIDEVMTAAERSGAGVLIDEAEALAGKRSEVKDAHDRYANIEVAYLLQRMEAFEGLAILTTNLRLNLDPAFLRRLRFIVEFPRPDAEARERIWRQCLPDGSHELDDAAFRQLARKVDVTGGHLRQITVRAAFIAAAAGTRIGLEHIAQATRAELAKLGMSPVAIDVGRDGRAA